MNHRPIVVMVVTFAIFSLTAWNVMESVDTTLILQQVTEIEQQTVAAVSELVNPNNATAAAGNAAVATKNIDGPLPASSPQPTSSPKPESHPTNNASFAPCPDGLTLLHDINHPSLPTSTSSQNNIPPVLYQTAKDRCISTALYNGTIQQWLGPLVRGYKQQLSYRFYDDARMDDYLYNKRWHSIFPALPLALQCIDHVHMPVMKADIWRYLVLWEYGGIFADLDVLGSSELMQELLMEKNNSSQNDALFVMVNTAGSQVLSQWFLAVAPHHPLMYYAMEEALFRILQAKRAIPIQHSGPRALYDATDRFLNYNVSESRHLEVGKLYQQESAGDSSTLPPRSFRVLPAGYAANNAFQKEKGEAYKLMNMTHYTQQQANQNNRRNNKNGGSNNNGHGNKKPYNGKTCLAFLGGKMMYPANYLGGASATSQDVFYEYDGTKYSFQNPMPDTHTQP